MDIDYDPTEEEVDDVDGLVDYDKRRDQWSLSCSEHGEVERAADGSADSHDAMINGWVRHVQEKHHGDGQMSLEERWMLIGPEGLN